MRRRTDLAGNGKGRGGEWSRLVLFDLCSAGAFACAFPRGEETKNASVRVQLGSRAESPHPGLRPPLARLAGEGPGVRGFCRKSGSSPNSGERAPEPRTSRRGFAAPQGRGSSPESVRRVAQRPVSKGTGRGAAEMEGCSPEFGEEPEKRTRSRSARDRRDRPVGTMDNSPPFQRWDIEASVPPACRRHARSSARPYGTRTVENRVPPTAEAVGYIRPAPTGPAGRSPDRPRKSPDEPRRGTAPSFPGRENLQDPSSARIEPTKLNRCGKKDTKYPSSARIRAWIGSFSVIPAKAGTQSPWIPAYAGMMMRWMRECVKIRAQLGLVKHNQQNGGR